MITITCRSCGEQTEVPDSLAGENEKCPKCGRLVEVPTLSSLLGLPASDALVTKHLPPNPPEKTTRTESVLVLLGGLMITVGMLTAVLGLVGSMVAHDASGLLGVAIGLGVMVNAAPIFALHHVLRYLRIMASNT